LRDDTPELRSSWHARAAGAAIGVLALAALFWPRGDNGTAKDKPGGFLIDRQGRPAPLAERLETTTLLHFWATWCPPCIDEIPAVQRLAADYRARPDFRVQLVAVEDSPTAVDTFLGAASAAALFDPTWSVAHRYGTTQLPDTHLLRGQRAIHTWRGPVRWDDAAVRARLDALLAASLRSER
jgi:thiol-disulfide isomerase/thioredoxin